MDDGEEAVGGENPQKQALLAIPVVDKLAAYGAVHALRSLSQIVNLQRRPVFAEAVGENTVSGLGGTEIDDLVSDRLDASDALDCQRLARVILHFGFYRAERPSLIDRQTVRKIGELRESGRSDGNFLAVSESVVNIRLRYFVLRVICRFNPLVIDLCRYSCVQDAVSTIFCSDLV